tara:strand:- start:2182 stop:2382 length:201 start_codon:yes stop_codon:yes gene_type:complete
VTPGRYKDRPVDQIQHEHIRELLKKEFSIRKAAKFAGADPSMVWEVQQKMALFGIPGQRTGCESWT